MPELPEVQTIVSDLERVLPNLKIKDVWSDWKKIIKQPKSFDEFRKKLIGKKIIKIRRKGKNILIDLSGDETLLIHQKMTGHILYGPLRDDPYNQYIHLLINLSNGYSLALSDLRKFAKVLIWPTNKLDELEDLKKIGPEPLDKNFTFEKFKEIFAGKKGKIKHFLMDQKNIAGIGNIYADEILWEAGAHPLREIQKISGAELKKIYEAIKKVLRKAIEAKGDSMSDYRRPSGEKGNYQNMQNAYRMTGQKCKKKDGGVITRVKSGGRGTHFCPVHQK